MFDRLAGHFGSEGAMPIRLPPLQGMDAVRAAT